MEVLYFATALIYNTNRTSVVRVLNSSSKFS